MQGSVPDSASRVIDVRLQARQARWGRVVVGSKLACCGMGFCEVITSGYCLFCAKRYDDA